MASGIQENRRDEGGAPDNTEISVFEVTPEMVEAGVLALLGYDPGWNDAETAERVYRAMAAAGARSSCGMSPRGREPDGPVRLPHLDRPS